MRRGPGLLRLLAVAGSPKVHRAMLAWYHEFGELFWFNGGPIHVRPHDASMKHHVSKHSS